MSTPSHNATNDFLIEITDKKLQASMISQQRVNDRTKGDLLDQEQSEQSKSNKSQFERHLDSREKSNEVYQRNQTPKSEVEVSRAEISSEPSQKEKTISQHRKKKKENKIKRIEPKDFPTFKCPKPGHNTQPITFVCTLPECPKRLLCEKCLSADHSTLGEFKKPFIEFINEAYNSEFVKDEKIEEFEEFLGEKENFIKNLDYDFDNIIQGITKEIENIQAAIASKLNAVRNKIIESKKKIYEEIRIHANQYEKKFNETYFEFDTAMTQLLKSKQSDFAAFEDLCSKIIDAPSFKEREEIINFTENLTAKIRCLEDNFYLRRLKYVQSHIRTDVFKLLDEVINEDKIVSTISEFEWEPRAIELVKFSHTSCPILSLCELEENKLAAGYGFPEFSVEIWDTKEMKSLKILQAHSKSVTALVYLKDQKILLSGSCDMYVYAWNIEETEPLWNYKAHEGYIFTMIDLGEGMWASGSHDKTIKIWKAGDYEHKAVIYGHSDPVWCIVKLQEPDLIASCSADGYIFVWDYEGQESIKRIKAHKDQVNQIVAYRKSELISCSDDSTVKLWDWKKGELVSQLLTTQSPIWGVLVAHDNETLFCYGEQANVVVYNMPDAQVINILYGFDQMIKSMIQTSEHFLVTGSYDFKIRYWHSVKVKQQPSFSQF